MDNEVIQYIGARYTTKIYENSQNPESAEWEADVNYEPLTLVTYDHNTYLSRKVVPANVGNPADNGRYWAKTGDYNGQIAIIQAQIDDMKDGDVDGSLQNQIDTMNDGTVDGSLQNQIDKMNYITPDNFSGDNDYEKLQAAIDYSLDNYYPTIVLNRKYDITGHSLKINKPNALSDSTYYRYRAYLTFFGLNEGKIYKGDGGYMFTADSRSGYISFINVTFEGGVHQDSTMSDAQIFAARKAGCSVFDCSKLLNLRTFNCSYVLLGVVFDGHECVDASSNAQSIISSHDCATYCHAFWTFLYSWNCTIEDAIVEVCSHGVMDYEDDNTTSVGITDLKITGTLIENIEDGPAIEIDVARHAYVGLIATNIVNSYFENCKNACIDITGSVIKTLNIENNYFTMAGSPYNTYNCIIIKNNYDGIVISHNFMRTGAYGIYCTHPNYENNFAGNTFEQVDNVGSLTNSTKAQLTEYLRTYAGSVETDTINGNTSVNNIAISDFGGITNVKGLVITGVVPNTTYNTRADITGVGLYLDTFNIHTYGTDAQSYTVKYLVLGL